MPRQRRVVLPGRPHHITQRGNNRRDVFFEDSDRELYLSLLREYAAKYQVEILGYCLMTNHVHLIAVPADATGPAKAIGRVHNDYARWLPIRRRESGHLWQNRFFSFLWRMPLPGRRLPMWSETQCVLEWLRNAKNGLGAVPASASPASYSVMSSFVLVGNICQRTVAVPEPRCLDSRRSPPVRPSIPRTWFEDLPG